MDNPGRMASDPLRLLSDASPPPDRRRARSWTRVTFSTIAVIVLSGAALLLTQLWATKSTSSASPDSSATLPTIVEVVPVAVDAVSEQVHAVGTLEANESIMVRPEIAGVVTRVLFAEGQAVEKGMALIELDDSELQAHVAEAKAQSKIARLTYDRMMQLTGNQNPFISQQQIDQAISSLGAAEANDALYQTRLAKTRIRAPFSGFVGIRRISPGDYVQPGQDLVNLEDLRTLKIDFKVPETFLNRVRTGQQVRITTDADPKAVFLGEIYVIDPRVDSGSRAVRVRARIPNHSERLKPGLYATVDVLLHQRDHALVIPEEAVIPQREKMFVYRVLDNTARWTEVSLGMRERGLVEVVGGLGAEDEVVRVGHHKLKDGMAVRPK
jgi:membrane fusion protein, multidrug efflux system